MIQGFRLCLRILASLTLLISMTFKVAASNSDMEKRILDGPKDQKISVKVEKQLVYGLILFDGSQYLGTFCPETIDTVYMIADVDNVVTVSKTKVYYWPITKEYKADWLEVNEKQIGVLEILKEGKLIKCLPLDSFSLEYLQGSQGNPKQVLVGEAAEKAVREYRYAMEEYDGLIRQYQALAENYLQLVREFLKNPAAYNNNPPAKPVPPEMPQEFVTGIERGFVINLPNGVYSIRFKNREGVVVPKSERKLVVFSALDQGIGYEIIPEDTWTLPLNSDDLSEQILARGGRVIYLKPFRAMKYNSHHYLKLSKLTSPSSGRGLEDQVTWIHQAPLSDFRLIQLQKDGRIIAQIKEKPYYVQQSEGHNLGYDILEFDEERYPGSSPTFTAFKIVVPAQPGNYSLTLLAENDQLIKGSERIIKTIRSAKFSELLLIALIPLFMGSVLIGWRFYNTKFGHRDENK